MAIIRINVAESISSNPNALQQVVDQIIDQIDDLNTGATGGGGGGGSGDGDFYTLSATDGDGEVTVNLVGDVSANSDVVLRAGNGMTINESGGTITFTAADGPDLGNYVTVNSSTGEIQAGTTTFQYLYRYLHIGFATDSLGSNFTTDPSLIPISDVDPVIFIGTFNSSSTTPPNGPGSYSYRSFVWSDEHNVFLRTVGGHQIEFLTSLQAIILDASPYDINDNPLDFDILQINNGNIVDGAVSVEKLSIDQLSAITADVGELTAGVIRGGNFTGPDPANNDPDAFGTYLSLTNGDALFGDSTNYLHYDATEDLIEIVSDLATTAEIEWVEAPDAVETHTIQVNSNTFSNQTANRNSHYAADGMVTTRDGNFWVGHAETPINDSTRAWDRANSTGLEITTVEFTLPGDDTVLSRTVMSNSGTVAFFPSGDELGAVFYQADNATMLPVDNGEIRASQYLNKGLSNDGNSVILGTDSANRITANYPGGEILDFTQFSTGKQGSSTGQAIISNNQNLDLPAGTYAISIEELAATRRHSIFGLSGMVGQVSGETFERTETIQSIVVFDGEEVDEITVIDDATSATGLTRLRLRAIETDLTSQLMFLLGGDAGYDSVQQDDSVDGVQLQVDSSRNLNVRVTNPNDPDFLVTVNGIRRVDLNINDPDIIDSIDTVELYLVNPLESSDNADSFLVNIPNGFAENDDLIYEIDYDRGSPSGVVLFESGFTGNGNDLTGVAPITFNENITTNDELLDRFETQFNTVISDTNNGTDRFGDQELRVDSSNVEVIISDTYIGDVVNGGLGQSNFVATVTGTTGNFDATSETFDSAIVNAHKFGIDPNSSNSVYGGWIQGQRLFVGTATNEGTFNVGVNGIYDQAAGNFDIYGSRQFEAVASENSNNQFDIIETNNSNTEFVRSNYVLSDTSSNTQSGLMIVSSVGPLSLTGEFYEQVGNSAQVQLTEGAGIVMQYKEIQS